MCKSGIEYNNQIKQIQEGIKFYACFSIIMQISGNNKNFPIFASQKNNRTRITQIEQMSAD